MPAKGRRRRVSAGLGNTTLRKAMTLSPGTRLGSYEIIGAIGAVNGANKMMFAPYSVAGDAFTPGQPQLWSPTGSQPPPSSLVSPYALHPDGKPVLLAAAETQGAADARDKVVFYSGFGEYLKKIAPGAK